MKGYYLFAGLLISAALAFGDAEPLHETAFCVAVQQGDRSTVLQSLQMGVADPEATCAEGRKAFELASDPLIVLAFAKAGAQPNAGHALPVLHPHYFPDDVDPVEYLRKLKDYGVKLPPDFLVVDRLYASPELIEVAVSMGADAGFTLENGWTPYKAAKAAGNRPAVDHLKVIMRRTKEG